MADAGKFDLDEHGVVRVTPEVAAKLAKMGIIANAAPGSAPPCAVQAHKSAWYQRPYPMGDIACDVCHPPIPAR